MKGPIYTPRKIERLAPNEVFVFGSNLAGRHAGGAAKTARRFGAIYGQGVGMQGQSYAIPTMHGGVDVIAPYVHEFIDYAREHRDKLFYVTRIGCGIASFTDEEIAPLFRDALMLDNVCLPESFVEVLKDYQLPESYKIREYGMTRTLADIVKVLNREKRYADFGALVKDLDTVFEDFVKRGTVTYETIDLLKSILLRNEGVLFEGSSFNIEKLDELLNDREGATTGLKSILKRREFAKLVYIIQLLNKKKRYASIYDVIDDILKLHHSRDSILNNGNILNDSNYIFHFLKYGLRDLWDNATIDGVLDNDLLEQKMFEEHADKLKRYGLDAVIKKDYTELSCHSTYHPQDFGTGPVYKEMNYGIVVKACNQGMGPASREVYEREVFDIIYDRDC